METGSKTIRYETIIIKNWEELLEDARLRLEKRWSLKINDVEPKAELDEFKIIRTIGIGRYGRVLLAEKENEGFFAIKVMKKKSIVKAKMISTVLNEKRVLQSIDFHFIIKMDYCIMDNSYLFFVMPYAPGGDLYILLRRIDKMTELESKFIAAQVVLALEYLHYLKIIYRDLKPENILIGIDGYVVLGDPGFCKVVETRTYTVCGTPEYIAPEVMLSRGYGFSADWWTLGILVYEMNVGYSPFIGADQLEQFEKSAQGTFTMKHGFTPELRKLLMGLLQTNPSRRLGSGGLGAGEIKQSPWFSDVDWLALLKKRIPAPFVPELTGPGDSSAYDVYPEKIMKPAEEDLFRNEFKDF